MELAADELGLEDAALGVGQGGLEGGELGLDWGVGFGGCRAWVGCRGWECQGRVEISSNEASRQSTEAPTRTLTSSSCAPLLAARLSDSAWCSRADPRSVRSESRSALGGGRDKDDVH